MSVPIPQVIMCAVTPGTALADTWTQDLFAPCSEANTCFAQSQTPSWCLGVFCRWMHSMMGPPKSPAAVLSMCTETPPRPTWTFVPMCQCDPREWRAAYDEPSCCSALVAFVKAMRRRTSRCL
ncbi:hypothetical protein FA95DRAFT_1562240 [Auriscalpium vulgare]|uniref:Uncharacterized protein n=1 Tax=Auriscalpium vulgare TaxID=40419 RepID=A0ACB8RJY4_9AGAM|nr:hypothetical protein FA95DRAFT_1562240 [Auriscalpium vulgare]